MLNLSSNQEMKNEDCREILFLHRLDWQKFNLTKPNVGKDAVLGF